jgi:hypothetical protein
MFANMGAPLRRSLQLWSAHWLLWLVLGIGFTGGVLLFDLLLPLGGREALRFRANEVLLLPLLITPFAVLPPVGTIFTPLAVLLAARILGGEKPALPDVRSGLDMVVRTFLLQLLMLIPMIAALSLGILLNTVGFAPNVIAYAVVSLVVLFPAIFALITYAQVRVVSSGDDAVSALRKSFAFIKTAPLRTIILPNIPVLCGMAVSVALIILLWCHTPPEDNEVSVPKLLLPFLWSAITVTWGFITATTVYHQPHSRELPNSA